MQKINLVALPCLCVDVFDRTDIIRPGGEALNFAAHATTFKDVNVTLLGIVGRDKYADVIMNSISDLNINTEHVRIDERFETAKSITYLTPDGDRYYKDDSWNGKILDNMVLNDEEIEIIASADVVFIHFWASCFAQVIELKKKYGFKLAVDFSIYRNFEHMKKYAPDIDFFMISGEENLLPDFEKMSAEFDGLFNMTLAENGSVTYHKGMSYRVPAVAVETIVDTTGCGDSYHAGFVCEYMLTGDILRSMNRGSEMASKTLAHYGGF